ncbi:hypothetical protein [uncultured Tateyamaria sp.]|uniref:hypothetical protein n=1 Tax=uncultured Tateyamaria sp. TaxID=455651 RepID=UPI002611C1A0|nr:hypothetical protein [uncultured Tateyamaria sp.]
MKNSESLAELVVENSVSAPAPLDPAIASINLATRSNRLTEGYDLSVSAFFGSERIELTGGDFGVSVQISIERAQIDLEFVRCRASLVDDPTSQLSDERLVEERTTMRRDKSSSAGFLLGASSKADAQLEAGFDVKGQVAGSGAYERNVVRNRKNWQRLNAQTILIGTIPGDLDGMELDNFLGWRVFPEVTDEPSGVIGTLKVREAWINFINVKNTSFKGRIGHKARKLFESNDQNRKRMFALLLRHLSTTGLSTRSSRPDEAVFAIFPFVVRPEIDKAVAVNAPASSGRVQLESEKLEAFLVSPPGTEEETLVSLGVSHDLIRENTRKAKSKGKSQGRFLGYTSPVVCARAYSQLVKRQRVDEKDWSGIANNRVLRDLINLDLVKKIDDSIVPVEDSVSDADAMFRHSIARCDTVQLARGMLVENPSVSSTEVAEMVDTKFGKSYSTHGTKVRVGQALKRWARWVEPHLIDPKGGAKSDALLEVAKSKVAQVGARTYATPKNIAIAKAGYAAGDSGKVIAERIGMSYATLKRWKDSGKLD